MSPASSRRGVNPEHRHYRLARCVGITPAYAQTKIESALTSCASELIGQSLQEVHSKERTSLRRSAVQGPTEPEAVCDSEFDSNDMRAGDPCTHVNFAR